MSRPLVIGLGNRWRGDDAVGPLVLDALRAAELPGVDFLESPGDSLTLINAWQGRAQVMVVDACIDQSLPVGTIVAIDNALADTAALSRLRHPTSSHVLDLQQAIELALALDSAPKMLAVFAVTAAQFTAGNEPSAAVGAAVERLAEQLVEVCCHQQPANN